MFPDWKLVTGVHNSAKGAQQLWTDVLDPSLGLAVRQGKEAGLKSWILPYSCVILLCETRFIDPSSERQLTKEYAGSHKRRDNRCHIAAPKLEAGSSPLLYFTAAQLIDYSVLAAFAHSLSNHNYDVHTQPEDPSHHAQPPLEDFDGSTEEQDAEIARRVELAADGELEGHGKKVLILRNSHIGGHKFAGNVIVSFKLGLPDGSHSHGCASYPDLHTEWGWCVVWPRVDARGRVYRGQYHYWRTGAGPAFERRYEPAKAGMQEFP